MRLLFDKLIMITIRKVLRKDNNSALELLTFYVNIKTKIFKALGSVIYCMMEKYLCVYYLCLYKAEIYLAHKLFEKLY